MTEREDDWEFPWGDCYSSTMELVELEGFQEWANRTPSDVLISVLSLLAGKFGAQHDIPDKAFAKAVGALAVVGRKAELSLLQRSVN